MGMNCAEDPFNMGMFYNSRSHSNRIYFQIPNTHIRAFLYWSRPPPPRENATSLTFKSTSSKQDKILLELESGFEAGLSGAPCSSDEIEQLKEELEKQQT